VPPEPVLGLSKRSLHLGLLLRRELVELSYLPARSFRRYVVATVHVVSELDQEAGPETAHSLELAAQREHAAGRTTPRHERVSRQARAGPNPVKGIGGRTGDDAIGLATGGLEENQDEENAGAHRDEAERVRRARRQP